MNLHTALVHRRQLAARRPKPWAAVLEAAARREAAFRKAIREFGALAQRELNMRDLEQGIVERNPQLMEMTFMVALTTAIMRLQSVAADLLLSTLAAGGRAAAKATPQTRDGRIRVAKDEGFNKLNFDVNNPEAIKWAGARSSTMITNITNETRSAVRKVIRRGFTEGRPVASTARLLRPMIGLNERQVEAVFNLANSIVSSPGKKLWAGSQAIRVPREVTEEFLTRRVQQYADRLLAQRAIMIARTETIAASNEGQRQFWMQAVDRGLLRGT